MEPIFFSRRHLISAFRRRAVIALPNLDISITR